MTFRRSYRPVRVKRTTVPSGEYDATVTFVSYDDRYVKGSALRVCYDLVGEDGVKTQFHELFFYDENNERTMRYLDYLDENGAVYDDEGLPNIVGMREHLVIKKRPTSRGAALPSIESREYIGGPVLLHD